MIKDMGLKLERIPPAGNSPIQPWNAADEYILNYVQEQCLLSNKQNILLINDEFGALSCALSTVFDENIKQVSWTDSVITALAIAQNTQSNNLSCPKIISSVDALPDIKFDLVLIKVPKTLEYLAYQLSVIREHMHEGTHLIGAGMVKHLSKKAVDLFGEVIGETHTSLAKKKARLIFSHLDSKKHPTLLKQAEIKVNVPFSMNVNGHSVPKSIDLIGLPNVFSKSKLDQGAALLIEQLHKLPTSAQSLIDLGCGNGVLGTLAGLYLPKLDIHFVDESYMAIESARINVSNVLESAQCAFWPSHCLTQVGVDTVDIVLCNPPFHQQHTLSDKIAMQMIRQSHQKLKLGGELWLVGNRHCGYHISLKKVFRQVDVMASNAKFVVFQCKK